MTPSENFDAFAQLMQMADAVAESGIRRAYPDADEGVVFLRRAARVLDRQTMVRVFGWDPDAAR